jgi:hypothetical protein
VELDDLHHLLNTKQAASLALSALNLNAVAPSPSCMSLFLTLHLLYCAWGSSSSHVPDVQTQMIVMLIRSFSKLSTMLGDKTSDSKLEWWLTFSRIYNSTRRKSR